MPTLLEYTIVFLLMYLLHALAVSNRYICKHAIFYNEDQSAINVILSKPPPPPYYLTFTTRCLKQVDSKNQVLQILYHVLIVQ